MRCENCKQYESYGMTTGDAWNHCKISGAEYYSTDFNCDLVDENGEDNGNYERYMQEYEEMTRQELQRMFDMNGDPYRDFLGNPW